MNDMQKTYISDNLPLILSFIQRDYYDQKLLNYKKDIQDINIQNVRYVQENLNIELYKKIYKEEKKIKDVREVIKNISPEAYFILIFNNNKKLRKVFFNTYDIVYASELCGSTNKSDVEKFCIDILKRVKENKHHSDVYSVYEENVKKYVDMKKHFSYVKGYSQRKFISPEEIENKKGGKKIREIENDFYSRVFKILYELYVYICEIDPEEKEAKVLKDNYIRFFIENFSTCGVFNNSLIYPTIKEASYKLIESNFKTYFSHMELTDFLSKTLYHIFLNNINYICLLKDNKKSNSKEKHIKYIIKTFKLYNSKSEYTTDEISDILYNMALSVKYFGSHDIKDLSVSEKDILTATKILISPSPLYLPENNYDIIDRTFVPRDLSDLFSKCIYAIQKK